MNTLLSHCLFAFRTRFTNGWMDARKAYSGYKMFMNFPYLPLEDVNSFSFSFVKLEVVIHTSKMSYKLSKQFSLETTCHNAHYF